MENIVLYTHELGFDKIVDIVETFLPDARIEVKDGGNQKSLTATVKEGFFSRSKVLRINYRQRSTPSYNLERINCPLSQNLAGLVNFIKSIPSQKPEVTGKLVAAISAANAEMPLIGDPDINEAFQVVLKKVVADLNCVVFSPPNKLFALSDREQFIDKNLNLILDANGRSEVDDLEVVVKTSYADPPPNTMVDEQLLRKARTEETLLGRNIKVNPNLPCVPSTEQTKLRDLDVVLERIYALLVVAVRGEGLALDQIQHVIEDKGISGFSPKELWVLNQADLSDVDRAYAAWRYESLAVLMWAVNLIDDLPFPDQICDVPHVVSTLFKPSRNEISQAGYLRDTQVILDALDKAYRLHWAVVDARLSGQDISTLVEPGVVYERHYALLWLTQNKGQEWDDVETHT
jgi:hypothetical protein